MHASHDGVAVVSHDPSLERVAGRDVEVGQLTMAELRRIDLGHGQGFASLEEALDAFPDSRFNIDVKDDAAVEPGVAAIARTRAASRVLLTSFSERRRRGVAALLPEVVTSVGSAGVMRFRLAVARVAAARSRALRGARALQVPERAGRCGSSPRGSSTRRIGGCRGARVDRQRARRHDHACSTSASTVS